MIATLSRTLKAVLAQAEARFYAQYAREAVCEGRLVAARFYQKAAAACSQYDRELRGVE